MKPLTSITIQISFLLILASCSSAPRLQITYDTSPKYGYIYQDDQLLGIAPQTLNYGDLQVGDEFILRELSARWPSGAVTNFQSVGVIEKLRDYLYVTIERPEGFPDIEKDNTHAATIRTEQAEMEFKRSVLLEEDREAELLDTISGPIDPRLR